MRQSTSIDKTPHYSDRLLDILMPWVIFTSVFPTLVVYRAALQDDYQWGLFGIAGVGRSAGFWVVLAAVIWVWTLLYLGSRPPRAFFAGLLVGWNSLLFGSFLYGLLRFGSEMELRGDALGIRVNLAWIAPLLSGVFLILSLLWWWKGRGTTRLPVPTGRTRTARWLLGAALALLPVIVLLFLAGDGQVHTTWDRIAVLVVIVQCIALAIGLPPDRQVE